MEPSAVVVLWNSRVRSRARARPGLERPQPPPLVGAVFFDTGGGEDTRLIM